MHLSPGSRRNINPISRFRAFPLSVYGWSCRLTHSSNGQMGRMSRIHVVGCEPSSKLRPVVDHYLRHRTRLFRDLLVVQHNVLKPKLSTSRVNSFATRMHLHREDVMTKFSATVESSS